MTHWRVRRAAPGRSIGLPSDAGTTRRRMRWPLSAAAGPPHWLPPVSWLFQAGLVPAGRMPATLWRPR
eukprot:6819833-Lingulodinium_polyedra.AAC.1